MFLNFVFVFVYIAGIYILFSFSNEKGELTILATKQGLLASYTTRLVSWQPIMDITKFADISTQAKALRNSSFHREPVSFIFFTAA